MRSNQSRSVGVFPIICVLLITLFSSQVFAREVRVGVYENPPKIFTAEDGVPAGVFVDVVEHVAAEEEWDILYVRGSWAECLERLETGEIDLMMDIAFSDARNEIYDFCETNIFTNWAQVYTRSNLTIGVPTDLEGMRVATLSGGIHLARFEALIDGFGINCEIVRVDSYEKVFSMLHAKEVDAGVVNRIFGHTNAERFNISASPVVFSPATLHFAVKEGSNADLLTAIDRLVPIMQQDPGSVYHQSLTKWLGETSKFEIPEWVMSLLLGVGAAAILLFSISMFLKLQVRRKTNELYEINVELSKQVQETMKAHLDLKRSEDIRIHQERLSALGQMVYGIAHDFNNFLTPILGYSDLMLENHETSNSHENHFEYMKIIRNTAEDARETVKRLQESMRADKRIKMETVPVAELVAEVVESVRSLIRSKLENITKPVSIDIDIPVNMVIIACRNQIKEALLNILINSTHAVSPGDEISISASENSSEITLVISDTGQGMSKEVLRQCMEPFFTTKGTAGTGMGLSMVYGIVKRHNGKLNIHSKPGFGTEITIKLPVNQKIEEDKNIKALSLPMEPMKILVIDDDLNAGELIAEYLKHDDHSVTVADSPEDAIGLFEKGGFDMIVTDMAMPGVTGEEVAMHIKEHFSDIPVLMITGFADLMAGNGIYPNGVDCIIGKPFTLEEIRRGIQEANSK